MHKSNYINGSWLGGKGSSFLSLNPVSKDIIWQGSAADTQQVNEAITSARRALPDWAGKSLLEREAVIKRFAELAGESSEHLATIIASETGKPLWEALTEAAAIKGKIGISIKSYAERTGTVENSMPVGQAVYSPQASWCCRCLWPL